jgi:hypothetical protein
VTERAGAAVDVELVVRDAQIMATAANASFTSNRSTSATLQPALANTFRIAGTGAVVNLAGSWAWAAWATMRACTFSPCALATLWRVSTNAAAPSLIEEALAAVMVPSLAKAGFSVGILSGRALPGCSSVSMIVSLPRPLTVTGTISPAKAPLEIAFWARSRLAMANASCAARVNW